MTRASKRLGGPAFRRAAPSGGIAAGTKASFVPSKELGFLPRNAIKGSSAPQDCVAASRAASPRHIGHPRLWLCFAALVLTHAWAAFAGGPYLIEGVALHGDRLVLGAHGQLWSTTLAGGEGRALTDGRDHDRDPALSPDGKRVAFLRETTGGGDLYLLDLDNGATRRLTWHPERDRPLGWTPDGTAILFASRRDGWQERLYLIDADGVWPRPLPFPFGSGAAISPDGATLAYMPMGLRGEWRYYRGGMRAEIHLTSWPDAGPVRRLTDAAHNAYNPIWLDAGLAYIADPDGVANLYLDPKAGGKVRQLTRFTSFGVRAAAGWGDRLVFERDGALFALGVGGAEPKTIDLSLPLNDRLRRERLISAGRWLDGIELGAGGKAAATARGEAFLVETATGKSENLTQTGGVAERDAVLSPQGDRIAYFSDETGEYQLHVRRLGDDAVRKLAIEAKPTFYQELRWSPDGARLAFSDHRLRLWRCDVASGEMTVAARSEDSGQIRYNPSWSPDGRYLAFEWRGANRLPRILVHDSATGNNHSITTGSAHATSPVFDRGGRYLYFLSSPNAAEADFHWGVLHGVQAEARVTRRLNAVVLHEGEPPPLLPAARQPNLAVDWDRSPSRTPIDFEGIERRILPIRLDTANITRIAAAWPGALYLVSAEWPGAPLLGDNPRSQLNLLDLRHPAKLVKAAHSIVSLSAAPDGRTALYRASEDSNRTLLTWDDGQPRPKTLRLSALPMKLDSGREWAQMYWEAWRYLRENLYAPNFHGHEIERLGRHYARYLPNLISRDDLADLIARLYGRISVSHIRVGRGDTGRPRQADEKIGLLGASFEIAEGRYRFVDILRSPHFDQRRDDFHAPLDQIGARVADGEYLLAVDDRPITADQNLYAFFRDKAGAQTRLLVGPNADGSEARELRVVPLEDEEELRLANWAAANRRKVDALSGGKLAYVYIDGFNPAGLEDFMRDYLAGRDKRAMVIDQRFNGGGITSDALIDMLRRRALYAYHFRQGRDLPTPVNAFDGPTTLLTNQFNGSAAETFALMYRLAELGPIVGKATVGAGIGPYGFSWRLADGARVQVPNRGAYDPSGSWGIENMGVQPHIEVEIDPESWRAGRDPQLERAVSELLKRMERHDYQQRRKPEFPVHPFAWEPDAPEAANQN